jgi:deoxyribose-phosphate aldolase
MQCFHIDRAEVATHLYKLSQAISTGAKEIEMVAAERVFDKSLTAKLAGKARVLRRLAKQLNRMHELAARARFPGD